jgi:hypothetical protein
MSTAENARKSKNTRTAAVIGCCLFLPSARLPAFAETRSPIVAEDIMVRPGDPGID